MLSEEKPRLRAVPGGDVIAFAQDQSTVQSTPRQCLEVGNTRGMRLGCSLHPTELQLQAARDVFLCFCEGEKSLLGSSLVNYPLSFVWKVLAPSSRRLVLEEKRQKSI